MLLKNNIFALKLIVFTEDRLIELYKINYIYNAKLFI